jgi:hypothetical protein
MKLKTKNLKSKAILFLVLSLMSYLLCLISPLAAHAQSVDLGIYPPVFQIQTSPPSSMKIPFTIQNFADTNVDLSISLRPFTAATAENGSVSFLDDLSSYPDPSLLQKIQVLDNDTSIQTLSLAPQQKKNLQLQVEIPANEAKGEYYVSLLFISTNQNTAANSSTYANAGIASNILLSVGPIGPTKGDIEDFSAPSFTFKGPVPFTVRVKNTSDHYITSKGDIVITNMFGQNVGKINLLHVNILSDTTRRIPDDAQLNPNSKNYQAIKDIADKNAFPVAIWPEKVLVGPYTATLTLALSETGPLFKKSFIFFAFPMEYLLAIIVIIMIIVYIIFRVREKNRVKTIKNHLTSCKKSHIVNIVV